MNILFRRTPVMLQDRKQTHITFTLLSLLLALTLFACALGSGSPNTVNPAPAWFNVGTNIMAVCFGILVLLPKTRGLGGAHGIFNFAGSMVTNYVVDGPAYFVEVLPFDAIGLFLSIAVTYHYRSDLRSTFGGAPTRHTHEGTDAL